MFAPGGANSPPARQSRAIRMHSEGPRGPSEPPDGCCVRMARRRSPSSASSRVSCAIKGARNACKKCCGIRLWGTGGKRQPSGLLGQRWQSDPKVRRKEARALWREGKRVPGGHLREAQSDPKRTEGKRQPGGLLPPKAAKRPAGVSKYKGCARPARRTPIFARAAKP